MGKGPKKMFSEEDTQMASRDRKRCSASPVVREMQIKTTTRYVTSHVLDWLPTKRQ